MSSDADASVVVRSLSKRYQLGVNRPDTLRDLLSRKHDPKKSGATAGGKYFHWALRDVNFTVARGQSLGIVGANGAGKSTLLKILSRTVEPTSGLFTTRGRVSSLLEVGTGFHPELTGRENAFYNGSILGMTRREMTQKLGAIFEFAEIGEYADAPVKYYSTGMQLRLAFAVAAQLSPDVLIVDEALAVGDIRFQQRCIDTMRERASAGTTVLFVTHSMSFVEQLCDEAILLKEGTVAAEGPVPLVLGSYYESLNSVLTQHWQAKPANVPNDLPVRPLSIDIRNKDGEPHSGIVQRGETLFADISFEVKEPSSALSVGITILDRKSSIARSSPVDASALNPATRVGLHRWRISIPTRYLLEGSYVVAFDTDEYGVGWVHNPYLTPARTAFHIRGQMDSVADRAWDLEREGSVKLPMKWTERTKATANR